ncbi:hypothetical protein [Tsukamurella paurometabola]|uniref:Uncharacterized protein n=1 Tax=Tsukamurella paurometabola TaxID=2061 RepID=A0ABS5NDU3_TSUPA|nr:hypothetical protein [Tsukamurella paurometabola]MBS4102451.1 hypothetical protein [Tsukamurella paurometabola]
MTVRWHEQNPLAIGDVRSRDKRVLERRLNYLRAEESVGKLDNPWVLAEIAALKRVVATLEREVASG